MAFVNPTYTGPELLERATGMLRAWRVLQDDARLGDRMDSGSVGVAFRADGDRRTAWPPVYSVLHPRDPFARPRFTGRSS
jgi:hypothetical protein